MFFYRLLSGLIFITFFPYLALRFRGRERMERFGMTRHEIKRCIWLHAASLGEVNALKTLINELLNKYNQIDFVLSTMTRTGQEAARSISPKLITVFLPFDVTFIMKNLFKRINPSLIILAETEFWPNMLHRAKKNGVPVMMVNARLSDKSYPRYRRSGFIWKPVWKAIIAVNAQSETDAQRFERLGFRNVQNTHNLKFCLNLPDYDRNKLRRELGFADDDYILVWGSSRSGEEKLLLRILPKLKEKISNLKIVLVPRHLHRIPEIKAIFKTQEFILYTQLAPDKQLLIVDEMGILNTFYALSDLAIVGGSFYDFGGHNPLEPAYYGKPIIIGNYHYSCRDSVDRLKENYGIVISKKDKLLDDLLKIYDDIRFAADLGANAKRTLDLNSDSLSLNLQVIDGYIKPATQ